MISALVPIRRRLVQGSRRDLGGIDPRLRKQVKGGNKDAGLRWVSGVITEKNMHISYSKAVVTEIYGALGSIGIQPLKR